MVLLRLWLMLQCNTTIGEMQQMKEALAQAAKTQTLAEVFMNIHAHVVPRHSLRGKLFWISPGIFTESAVCGIRLCLRVKGMPQGTPNYPQPTQTPSPPEVLVWKYPDAINYESAVQCPFQEGSSVMLPSALPVVVVRHISPWPRRCSEPDCDIWVTALLKRTDRTLRST